MRLLVIGASGHLGGEVCRQALAAGHTVTGSYLRAPATIDGVEWQGLDVRDRAAVDELLARARPDAVVSAAYVHSDWASTADGAAHVAGAAAAVGARLVHVSSDAVHGGRAAPYLDDEPPSPIFVYGAAKAAAEVAVRLVAPAAAVVRTSLILGDAESKQVKLCLDLHAGRATGALFSDEVRCPIGVEDLAGAVLELAASDYAGLLNVAGPQAVTRVELGHLVARRYGLDPALFPVARSAASGMNRPLVVALDSTRATTLLRTPLRAAAEYLGASTSG